MFYKRLRLKMHKYIESFDVSFRLAKMALLILWEILSSWPHPSKWSRGTLGLESDLRFENFLAQILNTYTLYVRVTTGNHCHARFTANTVLSRKFSKSFKVQKVSKFKILAFSWTVWSGIHETRTRSIISVDLSWLTLSCIFDFEPYYGSSEFD